VSEAITKACEICKGVGHWFDAWGRVDCAECDHAGRVPDVEATLRAEVARLELREPTQAEGDAAEGKPDETGRVWAHGSCWLGRTGRRCLDCQRWTWGGPTRCERCAERAEVARLTATLAERDGEVARLERRPTPLSGRSNDELADVFSMAETMSKRAWGAARSGAISTYAGGLWQVAARGLTSLAMAEQDARTLARHAPDRDRLAGCKS
jgi:hypothetical protein